MLPLKTDEKGYIGFKKKMYEFLKYVKKGIVRLVLGVIRLGTVLFCCFLIFWLLIIPISNEMILRKHMATLKNMDVGSPYEVIVIDGACGKLFGNGNGMEYLSVALIKTETELEESEYSIEDGVFILRIDNEERLKGIVGIYAPRRLKAMKEKLEELKETENIEDYYILYSIQSAEFGSILTWDLRAH